MEDIKVAVVLRTVHEKSSTKVWRFKLQNIDGYTLKGVELQLLELFPEVKKKGLSLKLSYHDSFVGTIELESDSDLQVFFVIVCNGIPYVVYNLAIKSYSARVHYVRFQRRLTSSFEQSTQRRTFMFGWARRRC